MTDSSRVRPGSRGFTLIEIVVVLTIISILASIAIVSYRDVQNKAEAARLATQLHYIEDAVIEAILSGARVSQFSSIDAGSIDQSVLGDYLTSANLTDVPPGFKISLQAQLSGDGSDQGAFLVIIVVEGQEQILTELHAMFPPHTASMLGAEGWIGIDSRSLALAPDSVF